jgi:hypothetical protein
MVYLMHLNDFYEFGSIQFDSVRYSRKALEFHCNDLTKDDVGFLVIFMIKNLIKRHLDRVLYIADPLNDIAKRGFDL